MGRKSSLSPLGRTPLKRYAAVNRAADFVRLRIGGHFEYFQKTERGSKSADPSSNQRDLVTFDQDHAFQQGFLKFPAH